MSKKTALLFINGLGCNRMVEKKLLQGVNIFEEIEDIIKDLKIYDKKYKIGNKTYSLDEIKNLEKTIHKLNKKNITYNLLYLLKNKYLFSVLNDLYLIKFTELSNKKIDTVHVMCDPKTNNQLKQITAYFCNVDRYSNLGTMNIEDNIYYEDTLNTILKYIKDVQFNNVIVIGHSYGGAMTSKIAKYLNDLKLKKEELSKLQMATIGSIYIPPYSRTKNVKLYHYTYKNDPAFFRCSRIKDISKYPNLFIMKPTRESFREDESFIKEFGKENLEAHTNYDNIINTIIKKNNTKIDINHLN